MQRFNDVGYLGIIQRIDNSNESSTCAPLMQLRMQLLTQPGSGEPALAPGGRNSLEALPARPSLRAVWQRESARVNGCRHRGARVFGPPRSGHRATVDEVQSIALRMCGAQSEKTGMGEKRPVPRLSSLCAGQCGRPSRGFWPCR